MIKCTFSGYYRIKLESNNKKIRKNTQVHGNEDTYFEITNRSNNKPQGKLENILK